MLGVFFTADGKKVIIVDDDGNIAHEYELADYGTPITSTLKICYYK